MIIMRASGPSRRTRFIPERVSWRRLIATAIRAAKMIIGRSAALLRNLQITCHLGPSQLHPCPNRDHSAEQGQFGMRRVDGSMAQRRQMGQRLRIHVSSQQSVLQLRQSAQHLPAPPMGVPIPPLPLILFLHRDQPVQFGRRFGPGRSGARCRPSSHRETRRAPIEPPSAPRLAPRRMNPEPDE